MDLNEKEPKLKETKNGNPVLEVAGTVQTEAYHAWLANGRNGEAPTRYLYVTFSVFEPQIPHVEKILARQRPEGDPRPQVLFLGKWAGSREYEGREYANFWVNEASPLLFGPLQDRRQVSVEAPTRVLPYTCAVADFLDPEEVK